MDLIQPAAFSLLAWGLSVGSGAGATAPPPTPSGPRINVLRVETRGPDVIIRFNLLGGINPELARKIEAGLETAIRYDIRLYRRYPYWFDDFVEARRYRIAATYDPVTREYVVEETMDGKALRRTTTRDFSEVSRLLVSRENLLVFRVGPGKPRRNLYVQMRASFDSGYLFTIIPVDSRTPWKKSKRFNIRASGDLRSGDRRESGDLRSDDPRSVRAWWLPGSRRDLVALTLRSRCDSLHPITRSPDHPIATRSGVRASARIVADRDTRSNAKS